MAEAVGLALGVAGIAGLAQTCLSLAETIRDGIQMPTDANTVEQRWLAEVMLFKNWLLAVGIGLDAKPSAAAQKHAMKSKHHASLDDPDLRKQVFNTLGAMESLLRDQRKLAYRYGLSSHPLETSSADEADTDRIKKSLKLRFRWAIQDKNRFLTLVVDMGCLVSQLYRLIDLRSDLSATNQQTLIDLDGFLKDKLEAMGKDFKTTMESMVLMESDVRDIASIINKEDREKTLRWLEPVPTNRKLDQIMREMCDGTCQWMIDHPTFQEWAGMVPSLGISLTPRTLFWLHGNAGHGKTFIAAKVAQYFREMSALPFGYIFCSFDSDSRQVESIVPSWIAQIASQRKEALSIVARHKSVLGIDPPTRTNLWSIFEEVVNAVPNCYFLADGFDETLKNDPTKADFILDERAEFLKELLISLRGSTARVMIISRPLEPFREVLGSSKSSVISFGIETEHTSADVMQFATKAVSERLETGDLALNADVASELAKKSAGMFLWVRIEIPRLDPWSSREELIALLKDMPEGTAPLKRAYDRNMQALLSQQESSAVGRALAVLRWTMYHVHDSLKLDQMLDVVRFEQTGMSWKPRPFEQTTLIRFRNEMLRVCAPFIVYSEVDGSKLDGFFRFTHFSVVEYLRSLTNQRMRELTDGRYEARSRASDFTSEISAEHSNNLRLPHQTQIPFNDAVENHIHCARLCRRYFDLPDLQAPETPLFSYARVHFPFLSYATDSLFGSRYSLGHSSKERGNCWREVGDMFFISSPPMSQRLRRWFYFYSRLLGHIPVMRMSNKRTRKPPPPVIHQDEQTEAYPLWIACFLGMEDLAGPLLAECPDLEGILQVPVDERLDWSGIRIENSCTLIAAILSFSPTIRDLVLQAWPKSLSIEAPLFRITAKASASEMYDLRPYPNALTAAILYRDVFAVYWLLGAGADPNFSHEGSDPPLTQAWMLNVGHQHCYNTSFIVEDLIRAGARPTSVLINQMGRGSPHEASCTGEWKCDETRRRIFAAGKVDDVQPAEKEVGNDGVEVPRNVSEQGQADLSHLIDVCSISGISSPA